MSVIAQSHLYENPKFSNIAKTHEVIGIIPFTTSVTLESIQMNDISTDEIKKIEMAERTEIQNAMYSWFIERQKSGNLMVKVQTPNQTNEKLKRAGVTYENFSKYTPQLLAKILDVDAVVMGDYTTDRPNSKASSEVLSGLKNSQENTSKVVLNLFIYNAMDGSLLVNYNKTIPNSFDSTIKDIINVLMHKVSKRIVYTNS